MKNILIAVCIAMSFTALSCGEGLYSDASDKKTKQALQDDIDFAFIQGKCQVVVDAYAARAEADSLIGADLYKYSNAVLACSGFDLIKSLSGIFGTGTLGGDPFSIIQNIMGTTTLTAEESAKLKASYDKILKTCVPLDNLPTDMQTVCGMTAVADTVRSLGTVALGVSGGGSINIDSAGMAGALNGKTPGEIQDSVTNNVSLDELNRNLALISGSADTIAKDTGTDDFSSSLKDFTGELQDSGTKTITDQSLADYLAKQFGGSAAQ